MGTKETIHLKTSEGLTWENIIHYQTMLEEIFRHTKEKALIGALTCILNEISAKENGMTITEWYDKMSKTAAEVQEQLGEYEYETETSHWEEHSPIYCAENSKH